MVWRDQTVVGSKEARDGLEHKPIKIGISFIIS
jgi:hypothetical protein